jgi:endonuclease/exonuclease/phosphatase family metal-dependent hydrolase
MRLAVLILVLAGMTGCDRARDLGPPRAVAVRADGALELALTTLNLRYETAEDRGSRGWVRRIPQVVRAVRKLGPDVLGVQEGLHGQVADLWASLPDYEMVGWGRDDGLRRGEYSAIFYRRDRFEADAVDVGMFWLSAKPEVAGSMTWGNGIPRVCTWVRLVDRASGRGFYVFNTHWDHRHQGSRERAARLIAERIDGRRRGDEPVVLMGDFNAVESNPAVAFLAGERVSLAGEEGEWDGGLVDVYQVLNAGERNRRTLHLWSGQRDGYFKIDHILVSRGARVISSGILENQEPMISDHHAVSARVVFPGEAGG